MNSRLDTVISLQKTENKTFARQRLIDVVIGNLGKVKRPVAHTLCGAEAIFERQLQKHKPFKIKCYENVQSIYNDAKKTLPKNCTLKHGDWVEHLYEKETPDFAWADYCSPPSLDLLVITQLELARHILNKKPFVYAVTFSLRNRLKGGNNDCLEKLIKLTKSKPYRSAEREMHKLNKEKVKLMKKELPEGYFIRNKPSNKVTWGEFKHYNFIHLISKYFYQRLGLCPTIAIHYAGGTKYTTPMVTLVYTQHTEFAPSNWCHSKPLGCKTSKLYDVYAMKQELLRMKKRAVVKLYEGIPWSKLTAGQKAWVTRQKNKAEDTPQKRAWVTRRKRMKA